MRYYNGNYIRKNENNPTNSVAVGIYNLEAQLVHKAESNWPPTLQVFTDPTLGFVEFSNRHIDSNAYMGTSSDYDGPYDVADVTVPNTFSGSARIYIAHKNSITTGPIYRADVAIACIQILNAAGNSLLKSWNWSGNSHQGWENRNPNTATAAVQAIGLTESLQTAAAATYGNNLNTSHGHERWSIASGTGSSNTGAADGISSDYSENGVDSGIGTILPSAGNGVVAQVSDTYYIYRETSSSLRYSSVVTRSSAYTFSGGEIIRIAHCMPGGSGTGNEMNPDDTLYIGIA